MICSQYALLFFGIKLLVSAVGGNPCDPKCLPSTPKVIDPHDCSQYYFCNPDLTPYEKPEKCQNGFNFNPTSMECDTGVCHLICGRCHLTCDSALPYDIIADVLDCSVFYECTNGVPGAAHTCLSGTPYFDGTLKTCVNNATACCNPGCNVHCEPGLLFAPNPANCKIYYECISGIPAIEHRCFGDEVYDLGSAKCSTSAKCYEWCNSGGGGEITTTPSPTNCSTSFQCMEGGFFPKCPFCHPEYFYCPGPGSAGILQRCIDGMDFNPVPDNYFCIKSDSCPYFPLQ